MSAILAARISGATTVIAVDRMASRLELAAVASSHAWRRELGYVRRSSDSVTRWSTACDGRPP
jgi:Zn-dependent alcohol dehydrogenase